MPESQKRDFEKLEPARQERQRTALMTLKTIEDGRYEFTVQGIRFQQNPKSPVQFAFVASANDLIKFCGVARKSHDLLSNYQRAIDTNRVRNEITPFFRNPENCSPTAIVISLQDTNVSELEFSTATSDASIQSDTLTLRFEKIDELPANTIVGLAKRFLDDRLKEDDEDRSDTAAEAEEETSSAETGDDDNAIDEDALDSDSDEETDDVVEIGKSMLRELRATLEVTDAITDELIQNLREMLRPALIIDGQHRLYGAAGVEEDIPILVCSLVRPTWKEQVFQFVVVNDKASGISKPFITSLAGMSLTGKELGELRDRLTQAGLKLWEVDVMQRMGYDSLSPFYQKIEFKVSGENTTQGLGYQTMKKVGKCWYHPRSAGLYKVMEKLYIGTDEKKWAQKALRSEWQAKGDWFEFLCEFWGVFRDKFEGTPIWEIHSALLTAVVIEMLQHDFFLYLDSTKDLIWKFDDTDPHQRRMKVMKQFRELVKVFAENHKASIYEKQWKAKSLSHKDGRKALSDFFRKIRDGHSLANHPIYTGQI